MAKTNYWNIGKYMGADGCPMELVQEKLETENKLLHTMIMAEFTFKCLYKGEKPLSKKDYARCRNTHRNIEHKYGLLQDTMTENEVKSMKKIMEGLEPFTCLP